MYRVYRVHEYGDELIASGDNLGSLAEQVARYGIGEGDLRLLLTYGYLCDRTGGFWLEAL